MIGHGASLAKCRVFVSKYAVYPNPEVGSGLTKPGVQAVAQNRERGGSGTRNVDVQHG